MITECCHPAWCYDLEYDRWIAESLDYVHTEVDAVFCDDCGEYRSRANGGWEPILLTEEDRQRCMEEAVKMAELLGFLHSKD